MMMLMMMMSLLRLLLLFFCQTLQHLFKGFNIDEFVVYGTFNELAELVLKRDGDIREMTADFMKTRDTNGSRVSPSLRPQIVLIDEVDVFFNPEFYGQMYTPLVSIDSDAFENLAHYAWELYTKNNGRLTFNELRRTSDYQTLKTQFGKNGDIIEELVKNMVTDLRALSTHEYRCINGRIGYEEHDAISYNTFYGYKTMWAHFQEHAKKDSLLDDARLKEAIQIHLHGGGFSYALIPQRYRYTFGVTGTLEALSQGETDVLENHFGLKNRTVVPSVYGKQKLSFEYENSRFVLVRLSASLLDLVQQLACMPTCPPDNLFVYHCPRKQLRGCDCVTALAIDGWMDGWMDVSCSVPGSL